jgi:hypothetical protein
LPEIRAGREKEEKRAKEKLKGPCKVKEWEGRHRE